jgi:hypothetical protein
MDLNGFLTLTGGDSTSSTSLSPTSQVLDTVVERLQTCAQLHTSAMDFEGQLNGLEISVEQVQKMVSSVESSLERVEKGLVQNMEILQGNMVELETRKQS